MVFSFRISNRSKPRLFPENLREGNLRPLLQLGQETATNCDQDDDFPKRGVGMGRTKDGVKPEPGTDDARSTDSEESRQDREQAKRNAERMARYRYGLDPNDDEGRERKRANDDHGRRGGRNTQFVER
jgi:hypothetical protein